MQCTIPELRDVMEPNGSKRDEADTTGRSHDVLELELKLRLAPSVPTH